jgi:hypothetical protein
MSIGGFMGPSFSVELTPEGLRYESFDEGHTNRRKVMIQPQSENWEALKRAVEKANVWQWQSEYYMEMMDGTSWELEVVWGPRRIQSTGSNAYPDASGAQSKDWNPGAGFEGILRAVSKLVGGRPFE